jgi:hypothetical protein
MTSVRPKRKTRSRASCGRKSYETGFSRYGRAKGTMLFLRKIPEDLRGAIGVSWLLEVSFEIGV